MQFRDLRADEVECRVAMTKESGISLLLYKNARCDMNILDETVGIENWQREHYECKNNLFCKIGINTNYANPEMPDRWIWKSDCGAESYTEKEKGEASDSFKRAGFNWGIGRELYTAPFIWLSKGNYKVGNDGKVKDNFIVKEMTVENKKITSLLIYSEGLKKDVYSYGKNIQAGVDYEVDYAKQCGIYTKTLAQMTGKTEKEIKAEAVKRAGGKEIEKLYDALAQMIMEAEK